MEARAQTMDGAYRRAVEDLKASWRDDPTWDIESTTGFEASYDELKAYRLMMEDMYARERDARLYARAKVLGCPGNIALVQYIEQLERRITELENAVWS